MRDYMGWQLNMKNVPGSLSDGLERYFSKYGRPPQILIEVSPKLENVVLPEGLNIVVRSERILLKNVILITSNEEVSSDQNSQS